ncbi:MAG: efflux RND transporter periplasmic adaptor subunit [Patescibacteria group bacterium]
MTKRNKILVGVGLAVVLGGGWWLSQPNSTLKEYTTTPVVRQDLTQTVSATGTLKTAAEAGLSFGAGGRVVRLAVKVGDVVKAGQQLAVVDAGDLAVQLRQYQASVASAKANLAKVLEGATPETITVSQQQVASAQAAYEAAVVDLANAYKNKDENLKLNRDISLNDLQNYLFKARAALDVVENTYSNSDYDNYLGINAPQYLIDAKAQRTAALIALTASEVKITTAQATGVDADILTALNDLRSSLPLVSSTLDSMFNVLLNSLTSVNYLTETTLATLKTNIKAEQTAMATATATIKTDLSNLQTGPLSYDNAIDTAKSAVNIKKEAVELAQAQSDQTAAAARPSDVQYYQALVAQAEAQVAAVSQKFADRAITAPAAGVVTRVDIAIGEYATAGTPAITVLAKQQFEIDVDVPESDIVKVKVGNTAAVTFDAFGDDVPFTATVVLIEPAQTEISGVVYYKIKMYLDDTASAVKPGMTANVDLRTDARTSVLVIPQRAVVDQSGQKVVQVMTDQATQKVEDRTVEVGLKGDDGLIEVTAGLTAGELVVTYVKENKR